MTRKAIARTTLFVVLLLTFSRSAFVCPESQSAIVTQFGKIVRTVGTEAGQKGLSLKWPWQGVVKIDRRAQIAELGPRDLLTSDKKNLQMSFSVVWRVVDPKVFVESGNEIATAAAKVAERAGAESANVLSKHDLKTLVSTDQNRPGLEKISGEIAEALNASIKSAFGVEATAVMVRQMAYPTEIRPAIFDQIRAERAQVASRIRAEAKSKTDQLLAEAKREREIALSKARAEADSTVAKAEAEAIGILNEAHSQDPRLYELVRMLDTYKTLADPRTTVILSSGSPLWKMLWQGPSVDFAKDSPPVPDVGPAPEPIAPSPLAPRPEAGKAPK